MRWFGGDIVQAVATSKAQNAIFVVFVQGNDEASQNISSVIESEEVSSKLEGKNFVAICLRSGTETFNQFAQIYRAPSVPSLYFIGKTGRPITIITQTLDSTSLLEKISSVEDAHFGKQIKESVSASAASSSESASASAPSSSIHCPASLAPAISEQTKEEKASNSAPLEDRVEHAKELLEQKRLEKEAQEEEEAREKELKRRQEGKNIQDLRRWQKDEEMKHEMKLIREEKRQDQEARQKILEQIAEDRANRKSTSAAPVSPLTQPTLPPLVSNVNEARLQFRFPDGSTLTNRFSADTTLAEVRQYLVSNGTHPLRDFLLATMFPRREFTPDEHQSTLRDLHLIPSAVVLVIPAGGRAVARSDRGALGFLQMVMRVLSYPVVSVLRFVRSFLFGGGGGSGAGAASNAPVHSTTPQPQNAHEKRSQRRSGGSGSTYRRSGNSNIHRLHQDRSSSDDENNTWNGNSTQQM